MERKTKSGGRPQSGEGADKPTDAATTGGNSEAPTSQFQMASEEFWTAARMEEAEPYPLPEISESQLKDQAEKMAEEMRKSAAGAEGGVALGGRPDATGPTDDTQPTATTGGYDYPAPFTRLEVADEKQFPYATVGKIFFTQNGHNYVGSAASIGNYSFFTAGHCVHAGDNKSTSWSTNLVFVPAYHDGGAPFGQWRATRLWTRTVWMQNGNPNGFSEDMGGGVLLPLNGRKISQAVGWLGFAWNWSKYQHWHSVGYPQAAPFNGLRMFDVQASFAYDGNAPGVKPMGIGNDMTGGCSGGPWIWQFGTGNYLNGVNSYRRTANPQELFSPYFGNPAKSLFDVIVAATP